MKKSLVRIFAVAAAVPCLLSSALAAESIAYKDVAESAWYYEAVQEVSAGQILLGVAADRFDPNAVVSKKDFLASLWKLANSSQEGLDDAALSGWAVSMDMLAEGSDLSQGISRQEVAQCLQNFILNTVVNMPATLNIPREFEDQDKISEDALFAVQMMQNTSLMSGFPDGSFRPEAKLTRAEAATILQKLAPYCENLPLVISLPGNASTGYSWSVAAYDEAIVRVDALGYEESQSEEGMVGTPSNFRFAIYGMKEGRAALDFYYTRSGEDVKDAADEKHMTVAVDAEGKVVQLTR